MRLSALHQAPRQARQGQRSEVRLVGLASSEFTGRDSMLSDVESQILEWKAFLSVFSAVKFSFCNSQAS